MIKKILPLFLVLALTGCKTNPPIAPNSIKTGEVVLNFSFVENNTITPSRTVLLEDFANVSCVPCVISNRLIQSVIQINGINKVVAIKFPTNFPSATDPFYLASKTLCDYRMDYYNIFFAPTLILDGIVRPNATDSLAIQTQLNNRLSVETNFQMSITKTIINGGIQIDAEIQLKNKNSMNLENLVLRFAIVEPEIEFATAPGSNGETKFYDVLRNLIPSNEGIQLSSLNQSNTFQFENSVDILWNVNKLQIVAFIQDRVSKEVYQAVSTH